MNYWTKNIFSDKWVVFPWDEPKIEGDSIIEPSHYKIPGLGVQVIDIVEALKLSHNKASSLQYLLRAGIKPDVPEIQDLRKCLWYLNREVKLLNEETSR